MKKTSILRQFLVMIFTFITVAGFAQINANGGFESWTDGTPDGWMGSNSTITASNVIQVSDAHTGNYACMLKTSSSHKRFTTQPIALTEGQQYTVTYWVKGHGKIRTAIFLGGTTYTYNAYHEVNSTEYTQFVDTLTSNVNLSDGGFVLSVINFSSESTADSLIVDDVEINYYPPVDENTVATPIINVSGTMSGTDYMNSATISITTITTGASIYYTIDGSTPTASSSEYAEPFDVTSTCTVKAIAMKEGFTDSEIATKEINIVNVNIIFEEDFESSADLGQMTQYSVAGDTKIWTRATYSGNSYAVINAYNAGANEDWLMTPQLTPGSSEGLSLSFKTAMKFDGNPLQLKYSTNYSGDGDPTIATWTDITDLAEWSTGNYVWANSGDVIIEGANPLYIAFVYTSTESQAAAWEVDDIVVTTSATQDPVPSIAIISPANGANYSTLDTLAIVLDIQNFTIGTDGLLKIESELLPLAGLTTPYYLNAFTWAMFQNMTFSPLPVGNFSATVSLVSPDSLPLATATTSFSVEAPLQPAPVITVTGNEAEGENHYYFTAHVTMTAENDAAIYYTTDGSHPSEGAYNSTLYTGPFDITTSCTVIAKAFKENYIVSNETTVTIVIDTPTVAAPTFNPEGGIFTDSIVVSIVNSDEDATVRYTTDGTEPDETSDAYSEPITITETTTLKAKAFKANWHASETVEATYTIVNEPILTVSPAELSFSASELTGEITVSAAYIDGPIVLTCSDTHFTLSNDTLTNGNSTVTVTFDGTEPATGIITVTGDTLSAQVNLTATATLPAPTFTPESGTTDTLIEVAIACENANAAIYYTTDGTTPDAESDLYSEAIVLNTEGEHTINAIAILDGWDNSEVATATYTIVAPVPPTPPTPIYNDTIIYAIGFENEEGFIAPSQNNYQNDEVIFFGPTGHEWGVYHGTVTTYSPLIGAQDIQMRSYHSETSSHLGHLGYTFTNFDLHNVTRVTFQAKSTNNFNMAISYSTDGGNTYSEGEVIELSSTSENYMFEISETGEFNNVRIRFDMVNPDELPTSGNSQFLIDSVVIFGIPGIVPDLVETPVISPNGGYVYDPTQVSIACATDGASIYYTTNGEEPTESDILYANPFTVSATTTVKAKAFKAGFEPSNVATATYTFPIEVPNIAAFKEANTATNNNVYKITGDVTFVYENGANFYIQDETGGLLIYDNQNQDIISGTYTEGDVISGGVCGSYTLYNGLVELIPTRDLAEASSNTGAVAPILTTIENINEDYDQYESKLVKLEGVTFTNGGVFTTGSAYNMEITQNGEAMQVRSVFKNIDMDIPAGSTADVTGMVLRYNSTYQIAPRSNDDIVLSTVVVLDTVATPVITVNPLTNDMVSVEITCATEGATIYFTLNGTTPTEDSEAYTSSFVNPDETFTVKAIAVKEGMANSLVASYTYIPSGIDDHMTNVTIYPNPTADQCHISVDNSIIRTVSVFDMSGKLIRQMEVNDQNVDVEMGTLSNGTYFLQIVSDKGTSTKKVVRQ